MIRDAELHRMPKEEEDILVARAKQGDKRAMDIVIRKNRGLVHKIARAFGRSTTCPHDDLAQVGMMGVMRAVHKYEAERGNRFISYATWWIRANIMLEIERERGRGIPTSTKGARLIYSGTVSSLVNRYETAFGRTPDDEEIATTLGISVSELRDGRDVARISFGDIDGRDDERGGKIGERIGDASCPNEDAVVEMIDRHHVDRMKIESALKVLDARSRAVIEARFLAADPATLEDLGAKFGVSRERTRQIELRAKRKLRFALERAA